MRGQLAVACSKTCGKVTEVTKMTKITVKTSRHLGFSLIELLVVATIIIILTTIGLVSFSQAGVNARDGKRQSDLEVVRQALVLHRNQEGEYPSGSYSAVVDGLADDGFLSRPVPNDPRAGESACGGTTCNYSYEPDGASFCLCAPLENDTRGNSDGDCNFNATTHYCVTGP